MAAKETAFARVIAALRLRSVRIASAFFLTILFALIINPIWLIPGFGGIKQAFLLFGILAAGLVGSIVLLALLGITTPEKTHTHTEAQKTKTSRATLIALGIILIVFIGVNLFNVSNAVQNCGDEPSFTASFLVTREAAAIFLAPTSVLGVLADLGLLIAAAGAVIICRARRMRKDAKAKLLGQSEPENAEALGFGILFTGLLAFGLFAFIHLLASSALRAIFTSPHGFWSVTYSPLSTWLRIPVTLLFPSHIDLVLRVLALVFATITLLCVYRFFAKEYSEYAGLVATALYGFSMLVLISATSIYLTTYYLLFFILAFFAFSRYWKTLDSSYLGLALLFGTGAFLCKLEGIVIFVVLALAYGINALVHGFQKKEFGRAHFYVRTVRHGAILLLVAIPYWFVKYAKTHYGDRDLVFSAQNIQNLLNPNIISVYPKTIIEQFTIPIALLFVIGLVYLLIKKQDAFVRTALIACIAIIPLATADGPYFLGADFGRYVAGAGIAVAGICAIFLTTIVERVDTKAKGATKRHIIALGILAVLAAYMLLNAFTPLVFEKQSYDPQLAYTQKYRPFEHPNPRFLPSRDLADAMAANGVRDSTILMLTYFPHESYDALRGLNNTYVQFRDGYFNTPTPSQNEATLAQYVRENTISYVILPFINSRDLKTWQYSCAFASIEYGDNPTFLPEVVLKQNLFKTTLVVENNNGKFYLLTLAPQPGSNTSTTAN